MRNSKYIKSIIDLIQSMPTHGAESVFRAWCECFALAIQNGCTAAHTTLWEKREQRYLDITKGYTKEEGQKFSEMCGDLTLAFEDDPFDDYLGRIYMELFGGQKKIGQCFTPIDVCKACAATTLGTEIPHETETIADECCGGGAMLIAACWYYYEKGVDYQRFLKITAGDIDALCVHMTYIQLSLMGARATVYHRNALTREVYNAPFVTPMEFLWPMK